MKLSLICVTPTAFSHSLLDSNLTTLRKKSLPIQLENSNALEAMTSYTHAMMRLLHSLEEGALAAPQVGIQLRLVVASLSIFRRRRKFILINPVIVEQSCDLEDEAESCFSIPGYFGRVIRPISVSVEAYDLNGNLCRYDETGFLARMLQHEIDHLDGILYPDRMLDPSALIPLQFYR